MSGFLQTFQNQEYYSQLLTYGTNWCCMKKRLSSNFFQTICAFWRTWEIENFARWVCMIMA